MDASGPISLHSLGGIVMFALIAFMIWLAAKDVRRDLNDSPAFRAALRKCFVLLFGVGGPCLFLVAFLGRALA